MGNCVPTKKKTQPSTCQKKIMEIPSKKGTEKDSPLAQIIRPTLLPIQTPKLRFKAVVRRIIKANSGDGDLFGPNDYPLYFHQAQPLDHYERELTCAICQDIMFEPVCLVPCFHNFCGACFTKWKKQVLNCPICRCSVQSAHRVNSLDVLLEQYLVKHPNKRRSEEERQEMTLVNRIHKMKKYSQEFPINLTNSELQNFLTGDQLHRLIQILMQNASDIEQVRLAQNQFD